MRDKYRRSRVNISTSHLQHGIVNSNLGGLCLQRARAQTTFAAGGTIRCTDRVQLPTLNCRLLARAAWRALRLKLLRRTACSRRRPPPGCDKPADCLRPALWWRVSHTQLLWRRRARSHLAKSRKPRQIICRIAIIRIEGQRLLPLFDRLRCAPDTGQGGAKIITRVQIIRLNFKALFPMLDRFIGFLRCCDRASPSP
jgi:hypothetical protein